MTDDRSAAEMGRPEPPFDCQFDGCDFTTERDYERDYISHEHDAEMHYEREHAGRVKVRVTLELEQLLGDRDPLDVADYYHDKFDEREDLHGWDVAYAVAEVVEEADPHPEEKDAAE